MDIHTNIPLKNFTTMKIGGNARFFTEARSAEEVANIFRNAKSKSLPIFILGGGSNVIANDEGYDGIIIRIRIPGFEILSDDRTSTTIKIGAGEIWDTVVKRAVDMNLSGIEAMSNIPGTTGAGPIQNMGAYGQEIADTLITLEAYDSQTDSFVNFNKSDCGFSYRGSIFRDKDFGRYVITSVTLKLLKSQPQPPFYDSLQKYLDDHNIKIFTQDIIRGAVIELRKSKLPDPQLMPNSGSFFKNAIVENWQLNNLRTINPDIPLHDMGNGKYKVPTGWLIDQVGLKGQIIQGIRLYEKNALVLVNESATSYKQLAFARNEIIGKVREKFGIEIEQEPINI